MSLPSAGPGHREVEIDGSGAAPLRRQAYPRLKAAVHVEVQAGGSPQVVRGVTLNLSRGGMLANLNAPVAVGEECIIRFPSPGTELPFNRKTCPECGHLLPVPFVPGQTVKGFATRVREGTAGTMAAFEFAILLEIADQ